MPLELVKFSFKKEDLLAAPKEERHLFILAGHFLNELSVLSRLTAWAANYESADKALSTGGLINQLTLLSYTASKVYEGWLLLEKRFTPSIQEKYFPRFNIGNKKSHEELKIYFDKNKKNSIKKLRNSFGFHNYDEWEFILKAFDKVPSERMEFYLHEAPGACAFTMSAEAIAFGLGKVIDEDIESFEEFWSAFNRLIQETLTVGKQLQFVLFDFQVCFINEYITNVSERTKINLDVVPDFKSIQIPYFLDQEVHAYKGD